jgi:hypothetical protein
VRAGIKPAPTGSPCPNAVAAVSEGLHRRPPVKARRAAACFPIPTASLRSPLRLPFVHRTPESSVAVLLLREAPVLPFHSHPVRARPRRRSSLSWPQCLTLPSILAGCSLPLLAFGFQMPRLRTTSFHASAQRPRAAAAPGAIVGN